MRNVYFFEASRLDRDGEVFLHARLDGTDCIAVFFDPQSQPKLRGLLKGDAGKLPAAAGDTGVLVAPATYENMLTYERQIASKRKLLSLHGAGFKQTMGMGNRVAVSWKDVPVVGDPSCLAGFRSSFRSTQGTGVPSWFIQQSIARELLPEGVRAEDHPGIGHTGGYGPRELMRAGLFAYGALGGYQEGAEPIGADADHAIIVGHDEASLAESMALNKLAMAEARDYTKFTVDTSQLFDYPVTLSEADKKQLFATFRGRKFDVPNVLSDQPDFEFAFSDEDILRLAQKYWRPLQIHRELYDYSAELKGGEYFDYELSLDETPAPAPADDLLFYLVALEEISGIPAGRVSAAGPNIGYFKRWDYLGDVEKELFPLANACSSIMAQRGVAFSVHSGDGAGPSTGRGSGVDRTVGIATNRWMELKLSDIYQELLWHALAYSAFPAEHRLFEQIWDLTYKATAVMSKTYEQMVKGKSDEESAKLLGDMDKIRAIGESAGIPELAVGLIKGVLNYGTVQLKYANRFFNAADVDNKRPTDEFFRRFVQYVFPQVRGDVYAQTSPATWLAYDENCKRYTHMRMRELGFIR